MNFFLVACVWLYPVHTTPEKFENAALFLRLDLPSTLIRHENGAFETRVFKPEEFENVSFGCNEDGKHFENGAFGNRYGVTKIM